MEQSKQLAFQIKFPFIKISIMSV